MREPPAGLDEETLRAALAAHYGVTAAELAFLPLGHDASAWVYRVRAVDGPAYFLKLRAEVGNPTSLLVPRYLHDHGVRQVVAPLVARSGGLSVTAGPFALILYPFVEGDTGMSQGMTTEQWRAYGSTLRQIHDAPVSAELAGRLRREQFVPVDLDTLRRLEAHLDAGRFQHPEERVLAEHWSANRAAIESLRARAEVLGRQLADAAPPLLLCHADIHTGNVLVDLAGQVWVVDWDEAMLAPRERDLMFVVGGISEQFVGPREEAWFLEGYGEVTLDAAALTYYRAAWALADIASFGAQVCFRPDLGELSRQEGARYFAGLFAQGEIVTIALRSPMPEG